MAVSGGVEELELKAIEALAEFFAALEFKTFADAHQAAKSAKEALCKLWEAKYDLLLQKRVRESGAKSGEEAGKGAEEGWRVISAPKPVDPEDRAIKWLEGRLKAVGEKHPSIQYEFLRNSEGLITGLRYKVENGKTRTDIEAPIKWALRAAAERPLSSSA